MKVYLCGSLGTDPKLFSWRKHTEEVLNSEAIQCINPARIQGGRFATELRDDVTPDSFVVSVDMMDVKRADVLLVVFWKQPRQSIGTWMEMGMAALLGKPIILVTDDPQVKDHPFVHRFASIVCENIEEGIAWIKKMV